ncbi:thyroid adenoma-associated protein homolog [Nephila pilipes]|uniref:Thyroid adenoma-associated protein homolog n=1 Tax=Nephila pilipes TaxID=299642 RepID=A0A8X6SZH6_NEPPI|nr:thyroid adenoma-associated protein homolog [Nephila pilipes]
MSVKEKSSFFHKLLIITKKLSADKTPATTHKVLKELYPIVQKCDAKLDNAFSLPDEAQHALFSLIQILVSIISNPDFPAESILLGSTCLSVLVAKLFHPKFASAFLISLYSLVGEITKGNTQVSKRNYEEISKEVLRENAVCKTEECEKKNCTTNLELEVQQIKGLVYNCVMEKIDLISSIKDFIQEETELTKKKIPTFHQIAILHGILSCQSTGLFPYRSKHFYNKPFLLIMFNSIHLMCLTPCSSQYHAFSILVNWLKTCQNLLHKLVGMEDTNAYFSSKTELINRILSVLESNWESPIKGVSAFIKEAYRVLIALSGAESDYLKIHKFNLVQYLIDQTMKLSWKVKGKYLVLSIILQFIDYKKFLESHPEIPNEVIFHLKANYASSVISEVYKSIILSMKKYKYSSGELLAEWCRWWKVPIVNSLLSDDKLLIQGVSNLILPWTLNTVPKSYDLLLDIFKKETCKTSAAKLILIRIAIQIGIYELQVEEINFVRRYMHHQSIHMRMDALSVLCNSSKKSEPLSPRVLMILLEFIEANFNIDSTAFQHLFLSQLRILFVRIRDSLVQEYRSKCKDAHLIPEHHLKSKNVHMQLNQPQLDFVDNAAKVAVINTYPGACFQRRRTSLHLLNIIFDVFITSPLGQKRKEKPSKLVKHVIQVAQLQGIWGFFNDGTLINLFPCIIDYTDEIRALAYNLMIEFSTWPGIYYDLPCETILTYGFQLCGHPDCRSNEAGALLISLVYEKLYVNNNVTEMSSPFVIPFLMDIIGKMESIENRTTQILPSQEPMGYLLALQYCLKVSKKVFRDCFHNQELKVKNFIDMMIDVCEQTLKTVLSFMKGAEKNHCPSFADIGEALENLVHFLVSEDEKSKKEINISKAVELQLTCCWHKVKNSCYVLCELGACIYELNIDNESKKGYLFKIAKIIAGVLITCRHRGIVDACSLALNEFCVMLLRDDSLHQEICETLLGMAFDSLSDATSVSVTRRSAGLPTLIQAVVSSENNNLQRKLLSHTIKYLLAFFDHPIPEEKIISDKTDLPQVHVYHILKILVMDSSLSQAILSYLDIIVPVCISGFSSSLWPIRNGALQLFGVLLPRICGQKKVREEDSEHNLISSSELFARCPSLKVYLHMKLEKCVQFHQEKKLCSELVPVLSIIVKLSPPQENNEAFHFKTLLLQLLDVPVWKVRDLVSSSLSVLVSSDDISIKIEELNQELQTNNFNCNKVHGNLLLIQKVSKRDKFFLDTCKIVKSLTNLCNFLVERKCLLLIGIALETILSLSEKEEDPILIEMYRLFSSFDSKCCPMIGQEFLETQMVILKLRTANRCEIPGIIEQQASKDASIISECLRFLTKMLNFERTKTELYDMKFWKLICEAVLNYIEVGRHPSVIQDSLKFLIDLCYDWEIGSYILDPFVSKELENLLQPHLDMKSGLSVSGLSFTMLSLCIKSSLMREQESNYLEKWNMLFTCHSQPRSADILRMQAACSVASVGPFLVEYLRKRMRGCEKSIFFFLSLCDGSILLMQDEDEEIRNKACEFPSQLIHLYDIKKLQFNIGIKVIFQYMHDFLLGNYNFVLYLWNKLHNYPSICRVVSSINSAHTSDNIVPQLFEQELVNVFAEPVQMVVQYRDLFEMAISDLWDINYNLWFQAVEILSFDLLQEINELNDALVDCTTNDFCGFAYPHHGFLAFKKFYSQVQVLLTQRKLISKEKPEEIVLLKNLDQIGRKWKNIQNYIRCTMSWFLLRL